jgi:hypothetical protein
VTGIETMLAPQIEQKQIVADACAALLVNGSPPILRNSVYRI